MDDNPRIVQFVACATQDRIHILLTVPGVPDTTALCGTVSGPRSPWAVTGNPTLRDLCRACCGNLYTLLGAPRAGGELT